MLNSNEQIALNLTPEVEAELNARQEVVAEHAFPLTQGNEYVIAEQEDRSVAHVDGNSLYDINQDKGWFREGRNGREVQVDDIRVWTTSELSLYETSKEKSSKTKKAMLCSV